MYELAPVVGPGPRTLTVHAQDYGAGRDFQSMAYDPVTDGIYGLGLRPDAGSGQWVRTLAHAPCSNTTAVRIGSLGIPLLTESSRATQCRWRAWRPWTRCAVCYRGWGSPTARVSRSPFTS